MVASCPHGWPGPSAGRSLQASGVNPGPARPAHQRLWAAARRLISSRRRPRLAGTETDGVLPPRSEVRCEPCVAGARGAAGPASVAVHVCRQAAPTTGARTRRVRVLSLQLECTRGFSFPLPWGAGEQRAAMSPGSFSESRGRHSRPDGEAPQVPSPCPEPSSSDNARGAGGPASLPPSSLPPRPRKTGGRSAQCRVNEPHSFPAAGIWHAIVLGHRGRSDAICWHVLPGTDSPPR